MSRNGLLLDDEDSLDESNTKSSSLILANNLNTGLNQQAHLQLDNNNLSTSLQDCIANTATACQSMSSNNVQLNTSNSNCTIAQNSITTNSIKIESQQPHPFNSSSQLASSNQTNSQNQYQMYQIENNNYSQQLQDDSSKDNSITNYRSDCTTDCKPNLMCNLQNRQSSIDSYSSDSFNLLHNALSTNNDAVNQNSLTTSNNNLNNNLQTTTSATTTTKRNRTKRSSNWSTNQKLNDSNNSNYNIKSDQTANCSPPSMIPTPPMENTLNCSSNQMHSNLVQSPLINELPNSTDFYSTSTQQQQQQSSRSSSILGATLQNRPNNSAGYSSMELINNHRRAYPSPTSSTSSAYMSPNSQTLNHSPNSNFINTPGIDASTKFTPASSSAAHTMLHATTNLMNTQQPPVNIYQSASSQNRIDHQAASNNVFIYNASNQSLQPTAAVVNLSAENQTSFNCENTSTTTKTYTNQCLSNTNNNIYNGNNLDQQHTYQQPVVNSSNEQSFNSQPYSTTNNMYLAATNQQFIPQSNQNYSQSSGYFNSSSNAYQTPNQLNASSNSTIYDQQYSNSFLANNSSSTKNDLFYASNDNYLTSSSNDYHNGHLNEFTNDYYTDNIYNNVCQSFNGDNYNAQDYQQLS